VRGLPAILARALELEAELARHFADGSRVDLLRREQIAQQMAQNAADFRSFVDRYQVPVKRRPCAPGPGDAPETPHCPVCAGRGRVR